MTDERRHHPRLNVVGVVEYEGAAGVRCLEIKNISLGGIRLGISDKERPGGNVRVRITFADSKETLDLYGQVVWARQVEPYEVGIRFLVQDPEQVQQLGRYLDG
jgi:hypothetical protein